MSSIDRRRAELERLADELLASDTPLLDVDYDTFEEEPEDRRGVVIGEGCRWIQPLIRYSEE
jgi:hypothetical protein